MMGNKYQSFEKKNSTRYENTMKKESNIERRDKIVKGLEKAYEKMLEFKRKNNSKVVVMRENKIVKIKP